MKKTMISLFAIVFALVSMSFMLSNNGENTSPNSKNSCIVKVTYSSGSPASSVKVGYEVGGGISCVGGGTAGYTDIDGEVTVEWSSGCKCTYIYIDGKSHKGTFEDGGYYTFTK